MFKSARRRRAAAVEQCRDSTRNALRRATSSCSVYRILKAHDLITSPAFVLITAADRFAHPTTRPNELWQSDFTYLRVVGWCW
jgi:putative transposase